MLQVFEKYNPLRSRCWRFDRVRQLIGNQPYPRRPSRLNDDRYTHEYYRFLLELGGTDWQDLGDVTSSEDPALIEAHRLRWSLDAEDRAIVEARLLARETDAAIARKSGLSPTAVEYYEALFFTVRDRLDARGWIIKTIRSMAGRGLLYGKEIMGEQHRHTAYRMLGYYGGPLVVDALVGTLSPRPGPVTTEDCSAWLDDTMRADIKKAAMMVVARFDRTNLPLLFRTHLKLLRRKDSNQNLPVDVTKNMEAFLKEIKGLKACPAVQSHDAGDSRK